MGLPSPPPGGVTGVIGGKLWGRVTYVSHDPGRLILPGKLRLLWSEEGQNWSDGSAQVGLDSPGLPNLQRLEGG